jgi:hypothetical protein
MIHKVPKIRALQIIIMTITLENGYTGSMKKKVLIDGILYLENIYEMLTRLHKI